MLTRIIPSSGENLPVIGLGTWQTFDVSSTQYSLLKEVLNSLYAAGGRLIDSSPMYGRSEEVIGNITEQMPEKDGFFYATKVWTRGSTQGHVQMESSFKKMKRKVIDLMQIHNLVDWQIHLALLRRWKEEGKIRYIGITHYHDSSHATLEDLIKKEHIDFVQFNYSILSRRAEKSLLPLCADKGVATLINRPFGEGSLFSEVASKKIPAWANELGIKNWGSYFLKFILANPFVTCVIPATGNPEHVMQNLEAALGPLPDEAILKKMIAYIE